MKLTYIQQSGSPPVGDGGDQYTGLDRFSGASYEAALTRLYAEKYANRKMDLILVVGPTALAYVVDSGPMTAESW